MKHNHWEHARPGETIEGGFIVCQRGANNRRLRYSLSAERQGHPIFEHGNLDAATKEAQRLAMQHPGKAFCVLQEVGRARIEVQQTQKVTS
jgi:hypothetical protein